MPQVVGPQLHVKPVLGLPVGTGHDAGVVHQDVDLLLVVEQLLGTLFDGLEGGQVELFHVNGVAGCGLDLLGGLRPLVHIAAEDDDSGAARAQVLGSFLADTSVGPWRSKILIHISAWATGLAV